MNDHVTEKSQDGMNYIVFGSVQMTVELLDKIFDLQKQKVRRCCKKFVLHNCVQSRHLFLK